jgi:hypothetical protein
MKLMIDALMSYNVGWMDGNQILFCGDQGVIDSTE